jgi:tetratricopeptide (TPR) repeat protein
MLHQLALPCLLAFSAAPQDAPEPIEAPSPAAIEQATDLTLEQAIERFEAFLEANPEGEYAVAARLRLASLLMTQAEAAGQPPAYGPAVEQLERVVAAVEQGQAVGFDQAPEAWYLLGWCLRELGPDRAVEAWQQVVALAPRSELAASSLLHLGNYAMEQNDWELATTHFEAVRACQADPATTAQATYLAGWTYYKAEQWDPATEAFAAVLTQSQPETLHAEALEYLVLVLVERCEAEGRSVASEVDEVLARIPSSWHASFLERSATVLEGMARFEEADALRARATRAERKDRKKRRKNQD